MLNFKSFLTEVVKPTSLLQSIYEEFLIEVKKVSENDDMGKLNELRLAHHLSSETESEKKLPEHHRSYGKEDSAHNGSPEEVHKNILGRMDKDKAARIDKAASDSADAWKKKYLAEGEKVGKVYWTSNADKINKKGDKVNGDHFKTTGVHDAKSNADVMVQVVDKDGNHVRWHGISAKIGKHDPNLNNPGLDSLEKISGHETGHFASLMKPHDDHMQAIGYSPQSRDDRHAQWKIEQMATSNEPGKGIPGVRAQHAELEAKLKGGAKLSADEKKMHEHSSTFLQAHDGIKSDKERKEFMDTVAHRTQAAVTSGQEARKRVAASIAEGLKKKVKIGADGTHDDSELRHTLNGLISPQTTFDHSIVHARELKDGSHTPEISDQHTYAQKHLDNFTHLRVEGGDGQTTYIKGRLNKPGHKDHGQTFNVAQLTTKSNSGPMQNTVGSLSLVNKQH